MTNADVIEALESSDLPRRLDEATLHPDYAAAMAREPQAMSVWALILILALLVPAALVPLIAIVVMPERPVGAVIALVVIALAVGAVVLATIRNYRRLSRGQVRRELVAVLELDVRIDPDSPGTDCRVVLWSPGRSPFREQVKRGTDCRIGDVGVALYRGDRLIELVKIPVEWTPLA